MKKAFLILCILFGTIEAQGQVKSVEAMKKLELLEGNWQGIANATIGPGQKVKLDQHENVEFRLGGKMLVIEGKGFENEELKFNAFAIISYDESKQDYEMQSWLATGEKTKAYFKSHDPKNWEWGFEIPEGKIRYFITINDQGQWVERGEFSPNGTVWYPNFDMILNKK